MSAAASMPDPPELPDLDLPEPSPIVRPPVPSVGFMRIADEDYFADPCPTPSLSASIAKVLDAESPLHAWTRHPRFGGVSRRPTKALDKGALAHVLLLGRGKEIAVIDYKDFKTKAAQTERDEAREAGKIPVLRDDYEEARQAADTLRQRFADLEIVLDGESEIAAFWTERMLDGTEVQCRAQMDHVKLHGAATIYDLKSARSAHPEACRRHIEAYGYDIQRAAYVSAVERIKPELAGRIDFVFVFFETEPPFAVTPRRLSGAFWKLGERKWRSAVETWERCLRTNRWPAYADRIEEIEPPTWALTKDLDKQLAAMNGVGDTTEAWT